jgi:hypothetical protein
MEGRFEMNHFRELQPSIQYETKALDTTPTSEMAMVLFVMEAKAIPFGQ